MLAGHQGEGRSTGSGGWAPARRRLGRNRVALAFGVVFAALVLAAAAAPLWAEQVARTGPAENHLTQTIELDGRRVDVVSERGVPIGPTWHGRFFLGADTNGRDVMVRLLYGARNSLEIGFAAALAALILGALLGLVAGYFRGPVDAVIARGLDVLWSFPVVLLGIALGTALAIGGLKLGPIELSPGSLLLPIAIITVAFVPYLARPLRAQVLGLREREFVEAARAQGMRPARIIVHELLPHVAPTIIVLFPMLVANAILLEAALSYLGVGIQPPTPSLGTMIADGIDRIASAPHLALAPGLVLLAIVLSLNMVAEGVRAALDPRAPVRIGR